MLNKDIKQINKDESGSGLVLSLMVLLVLSALTASLGVVTIGSLRLGDVNRDSTSAYYIAEAGANMAYEEFKKSVIETYDSQYVNDKNSFFREVDDFTITEPYSFEEQFDDVPTAAIVIEEGTENGNEKEYVIKSTGEVAGKQRTVHKKVELAWTDKDMTIPDFLKRDRAAISMINPDGELSLKKQALIEGNIYHYKITFKNGNSNNFEVPKKDTGSRIALEKGDRADAELTEFNSFFENMLKNLPKSAAESKEYTIADDNGVKTYKLQGDTYIDTFAENEKIEIDTGDKAVNLVVKKLDLKKDLNLVVKGTGVLNLFVLEEIKFENGGNPGITLNKNGENSSLNIFYYGKDSNEILDPQKLTLHGNLIIRKAKFMFHNNHTKIKGSLVSGGDVDIETNAGITFHPVTIAGLVKGNDEDQTGDELIKASPAIEP